MLDRAVAIMREVQVGMILTHTRDDPGNLDHVVAAQFALAGAHERAGGRPQGRQGDRRARDPRHDDRRAAGVFLRAAPVGAVQLQAGHAARHHAVWEQKWAAIQCIESQPLMWEHYRNMAIQRGSVARGRPKYAEAFQRIFPSTVQELT